MPALTAAFAHSFRRLASFVCEHPTDLVFVTAPASLLGPLETVRLGAIEHRLSRYLASGNNLPRKGPGDLLVAVAHTSLRLGDSKLITELLKRQLEPRNIFAHRHVLATTLLALTLVFESSSSLGPARGLRISVSGKVAVAGNARRRSVTLVLGQRSHSNLSLCASESRCLIKTTTGCLGAYAATYSLAS